MTKKNKQDRARDSARSLYMTGQFTQKQIAEIVNVSPRTILRWVHEDKWDVILDTIQGSREKRITKYQKYLADIETTIESRPIGQRMPTSAEIDQMSKLENIIKKLTDTASLGEIVQYSKNVCLFVQQYDVEKAKELSGIFDNYIKSLV